MANASGTRVYQNYFGDGYFCLNGPNAGVDNLYTAGEWFTVRIEYTVIGADKVSAVWDVRGYVNGENVLNRTSVTNASSYADSLSIDCVKIIPSTEFIGYLDIDDVAIYQMSYTPTSDGDSSAE